MADDNKNIIIPVLRPYSHQGIFRFWCHKVLPLVYDDSLSYYELLCKVIHYLNTVIEDIDACEENITKLYEAFLSLKDEVDEFEDNIEQKIEDTFIEMAEEGEIADLIQEAVEQHSITNVYWDSLTGKIKQTKNGSNVDVVEVLQLPVENSANPVSSGALYTALEGKANKSTTVQNVFWNADAQEIRQDKNGVITPVVAVIDTVAENAHNPVSSGGVFDALAEKVDKASGITNVYWNANEEKIKKTINGVDSDVVAVVNVASENSTSPISSGGAFTELAKKVDKTAGVTGVFWDSSSRKIKETINGVSSDVVEVLDTITDGSANPVTADAIHDALENKMNVVGVSGSVSANNVTLNYYKFGRIVIGHFAGIPNTTDTIEFTLPWNLIESFHLRMTQWGANNLTDIFAEAGSNWLRLRGQNTAGNYYANVVLVAAE